MKLKDLQKVKNKNPVAKKWHVSYARKSSEDEDRQMSSIPDQTKALSELSRQKKLAVIKKFSEARSAKAPGRSVFNEMLEFIRSRDDIKGIICWKLNRLTRNPVDTGALQWMLQNKDIEEIVTPSKTYTVVDSDFLMAVEGAQANRFIRDLREDTQRGINSKLERGLAPILAPVGYRNNMEKKQGEKDISPHPIYFTLMRKLFDQALTGNFSLQDLAFMAKELGIKNSRDKWISKTQIHKIVRNPFYTGRFIYAEKVYFGKHDPMLTDDEFDLLQDIVSNRSRPKKQKHEFWHTGIPIVCGECGGHITGEIQVNHYKNGSQQTFRYARCTKKNGSNCSQAYISTEELEKQVVDILGTIQLPSEFVDWAIKWINTANAKQREVREANYRAFKSSYENIVRKLDNLLELKISPSNTNGSLISEEEFLEKKTNLLVEKKDAQEKLDKIDKHIDEWSELVVKTFEFASKAQEQFRTGDIQERKTILRAIGSNLVLNNKKLSIGMRLPFFKIQGAMKEIGLEMLLEPKEKLDRIIKTGNFDSQNIVLGG